MNIDPAAYVLVDLASGSVFDADTTVVIPHPGDADLESEEFLEYAEEAGVPFVMPGSGELTVDELLEGDADFLAVHLDSESFADPADLVLIPAPEEELSPDQAIAAARAGEAPEIPQSARDIQAFS